MINEALRFAVVSPSDLPALARELQEAGLPCADVAQPGRVFYAFEMGGQHVGYAGLEMCGPDALLRSVLVLPQQRRRGLGGQMVRQMEQLARRAGIANLHLLTSDQTAFFERIGYLPGQRMLAPGAIAATEQFRSLCPASATYLRKHLGAQPAGGPEQ